MRVSIKRSGGYDPSLGRDHPQNHDPTLERAATHAYVSRRPCGHPLALMVDMPDDTRGTAKFVAAEVRAGQTIERVTIEEARAIGVVYCYCVERKRAKR